ncbi:hypothetical protein CDG77_27565 [Nostoc sp. 'Peltigera membranacea cyanobiont' 213]|uniref:hypothetical protein n=1 Tax=Nostoc sp. 'Peltigera membranacea cyanobiont' 213 TaxID=2014530 RepID=UPI000B95A2F9|nr:hypothetical protein [Nostoc sp. 'Peltigera membranacea cyanobiont' 213]OYD87762.1 hypothetical protein CDG77_27565 [Nostoc sp. 'Peltigera membranacea cyanobiont' 213]
MYNNSPLLPCSPAQAQALSIGEKSGLKSLSDRINRVYSDSLEETVKNLLQSLGKLNRPYLTAVEEKLLNVLESEYGEKITP